MSRTLQDTDYTALKFCVLLILVFALQSLTPFDPGYQAGESPSINFLLSFLGHSSGEHLLNNLFFIGVFGTLYEIMTSRDTFIFTFLVSAVFANFTAFIFYTNSYIIGASGGAMGVMAALAVYKPRKIGLALGVPVPMYVVLAIYIMINLAGLGVATGTAYEAHLFGLFTGSLIGLWLREQEEVPKKERAGPGKKKRHELEDRGVQKSVEGKQSVEDDLFENWERRIRDWERKYMMD